MAPPVVPHRDDTPTEHGFVSLVAGEEGGVRAFWIDGRNLAPDSLTREPRTTKVEGLDTGVTFAEDPNGVQIELLQRQKQ